MPQDTLTTLRIAVAQSTVREDPTNAALLRESGAEVRRLMKQAADAGARLVHFTEGAICFPSKRVMSELGPDEIGPSDWRKAQWTVLKEELDRIAALSGELEVWTVIPSVNERSLVKSSVMPASEARAITAIPYSWMGISPRPRRCQG